MSEGGKEGGGKWRSGDVGRVHLLIDSPSTSHHPMNHN